MMDGFDGTLVEDNGMKIWSVLIPVFAIAGCMWGGLTARTLLGFLLSIAAGYTSWFMFAIYIANMVDSWRLSEGSVENRISREVARDYIVSVVVLLCLGVVYVFADHKVTGDDIDVGLVGLPFLVSGLVISLSLIFITWKKYGLKSLALLPIPLIIIFALIIMLSQLIIVLKGELASSQSFWLQVTQTMISISIYMWVFRIYFAIKNDLRSIASPFIGRLGRALGLSHEPPPLP
ncbi:hypothetical protein [Rhodanobacter sp. L36]|uniref:hypothetical protein n=1 Tax=Rhodanobacter sp. L36 TaxID=1747221 RepID=UPI00131DAC7F|nr:hypothetical protein [Rhodanobacter sp. L36]